MAKVDVDAVWTRHPNSADEWEIDTEPDVVCVVKVKRSTALGPCVLLTIDDGKRPLRARLTLEQWRAMSALPVGEAPAPVVAKGLPAEGELAGVHEQLGGALAQPHEPVPHRPTEAGWAYGGEGVGDA